MLTLRRTSWTGGCMRPPVYSKGQGIADDRMIDFMALRDSIDPEILLGRIWCLTKWHMLTREDTISVLHLPTHPRASVSCGRKATVTHDSYRRAHPYALDPAYR